MRKLLFTFALLLASAAAQTRVTVADTMYRPDGDLLSGTLTIQNPTMTSPDGKPIPANSFDVRVKNGVLSVQLVPNVGSTPTGTSYKVSYQVGNSTVRETWVVPASPSTVALADVRTLTPPVPSSQLAISQVNPPSGCDDNELIRWTGAAWDCITASGTGSVTNTGTLTADRIILGNGGADIKASPISVSDTTISGDITGNAGTVTNGVYTSGSYSNPAWLTALAAAKITGLATIATSGSASDLGSGTVPDARFPATLPASSGVNLTNLNATNIASGTVANARLDSAVSLLGQTISGSELGNPAVGTKGGVEAKTCTGSDKLTGIGTDGIPTCGTDQTGGGGGSSAFADLTSGTNTTAAMVIGTGASLGVTGSGTIAATTAAALGANGGNCSSGNAPLGVDAAGAVEGCFDVATQSELNTHAALTSAHSSTSANTANTIIERGSSGEFASGNHTLGGLRISDFITDANNKALRFDPSDSDAPFWNLNFAEFANGTINENNTVMRLCYNGTAGGAREDTNKPAWCFEMEGMYETGGNTMQEAHFAHTSTSGTLRRLLTMLARSDGYFDVGLNVDKFYINDDAGNAKVFIGDGSGNFDFYAQNSTDNAEVLLLRADRNAGNSGVAQMTFQKHATMDYFWLKKTGSNATGLRVEGETGIGQAPSSNEMLNVTAGGSKHGVLISGNTSGVLFQAAISGVPIIKANNTGFLVNNSKLFQCYSDNQSTETCSIATATGNAQFDGTVTAGAFSGPLTGNVTGNVSGSSGSTTGNAATATALQTARAIYGNNFDGTAALTQIIASTYGGTGNGFTKFTGPATSEKTFTLPNASATVLTDNAAVTVAQGGTGITSGNSGGVPYFSASNAIASSAALTANAPVIGGGAGSAPSVGSRSGNTTEFATVSGTKTVDKQLKFDASGNIVASTSDIGGGGSSATYYSFYPCSQSEGGSSPQGSILTPPTASGGAQCVIVGTAPHIVPVLLFNSGSNQFGEVLMTIPDSWGGTIDVQLAYYTSATTAGNLTWEIKSLCRAAGTVVTGAPSYNAANTITQANNTTTADAAQLPTVSVTTTGCSSGNPLFIQIKRTDSVAVSARLFQVRVKL